MNLRVSWLVDYFPRCEFHVFLSHSREDHDRLVRPVHDSLRRQHYASWLDHHHYPYGVDSRTALRAAVLTCRHVVFFVTDAMVANARGWCVLELAYAELLQQNLTTAEGPHANVVLPLFFVSQASKKLPRTVWQSIRDRGAFHNPNGGLDAVAWATGRIMAFLKQESRNARRQTERSNRDVMFQESLASPIGLFERVTKFDPQPIPEE